MSSILYRFQPLTDVFDLLHSVWERPFVQKGLAFLTLIIYVVALAGIEANRQGWIPAEWNLHVPRSHFEAIHLAFTLILCMEVLSLIFIIASSTSSAVGKQFEILALILLRNAFKELSNLPEPISVADPFGPVGHIAISAVGALIIFSALGVYMHMDRGLRFLNLPEVRMRFVMSKKLLSLVLLAVCCVIGVQDAWLFFVRHEEPHFFETVYTTLIFADIALVLISQRYMPGFYAVFRNSGFVIGTLLMRLALSAPSPWDTVISAFAAAYVLALTWVTSKFVPRGSEGR